MGGNFSSLIINLKLKTIVYWNKNKMSSYFYLLPQKTILNNLEEMVIEETSTLDQERYHLMSQILL